jgi:hypothetical protein
LCSPIIRRRRPDRVAIKARNLARLRDQVDVAKPRMRDGSRVPQRFYLRIGEHVLDVVDGAAGEAWMPDDVVFVEALSYGATGKIPEDGVAPPLRRPLFDRGEADRVKRQAACLPPFFALAGAGLGGPGRAPGPGRVWTSLA